MMPATSYNRRIAETILELGLYPPRDMDENALATLAMGKALEIVVTYEKVTGHQLNEDTCQMILDALRGDYRVAPEA